MGRLKLKKISFITIRLWRDVDIEKLLVSNKILLMKKNYKYFVDYLYNDHKVTLLHIVLPKTSAYVKSCDGQTKWMYFLLKMMTYKKYIKLFGIKSVLISGRI